MNRDLLRRLIDVAWRGVSEYAKPAEGDAAEAIVRQAEAELAKEPMRLYVWDNQRVLPGGVTGGLVVAAATSLEEATQLLITSVESEDRDPMTWWVAKDMHIVAQMPPDRVLDLPAAAWIAGGD